MHRIFSRPLAALSAFAVGVMCVLLAGIYPRLEDKFTDAVVAVWNTERFRAVSIACGPYGSTTEYVTLFGQRLQSAGTTYPSRPLAEQALEEELKGASQIIERKPVVIDGEAMGERAVVILPSGAAILKIEGATLYTIAAPSIGLATELESYKENW